MLQNSAMQHFKWKWKLKQKIMNTFLIQMISAAIIIVLGRFQISHAKIHSLSGQISQVIFAP